MSEGTLEAADPADPVAKPGGSLGKLVRGGIWTFGGRIWLALAGVVGTACWTRVLSHAEMGDYQFAQTLVIYGGIIGSLGFSLLVVRLTAAHLAAGRVELARQTIARCLLLALAGSLTWGVFYYFVAPFVFEKYPSLLANHGLMTLWLILVPVTLVMAESFRGLHDIRDSVLFGGAAFNFVYIGGAVIFAWLGGLGFTSMLVLATCAAAFNLAMGLLLLRKRVAGLKAATGDIVTGAHYVQLGSGELLREALPLMLNLLFGLLIGTLDLWIVGLWFRREDMANYALAARVVLVIVMPSQIVQGVIPPMISELHELGKRHELEQLLRGSATAAAIPSFLAMLVILLAGGWIVPVLFTDNFGPAAFTLSLLTFGQMISVLTGSPNFLLMMTGHQRSAAVCGVAALILLSVLAAVLGHVWGPNGVAIAAGISLSVYKISLALLGWQLLNVRCWVDPTLSSLFHLMAQRRAQH